MGSINLDSLKNTQRNVENYTYVDLWLDLQEIPTNLGGNFLSRTTASRDIKVAYDINAIKNSIRNLFNTVPGERFLLPDYGEDLRRYLFERITEGSGQQLGRSIRYSIEKWEPRVTVRQISVDAYVDQQEYRVTLSLYVPTLKQNVTIAGVFTRQGYLVL